VPMEEAMAIALKSLRRALGARARDERGSVLLEALASAALLSIAVIAVMAGVDGATASSARDKANSVAAQLAEQDQERMRAMRFVDLSNHRRTQALDVRGATYTVDSRADWIRDAGGNTENCTSDATQSDYLRIRSTVTSEIVGNATRPVVIDSLVAPPVATFGPDDGTLTVKLVDRDDQPLANINVSISGPRNLSDVTNSAGCAIFGFIPAGDYDIGLNQPGWITDKPNPSGTVQAGETTVTTVRYDEAAHANTTFYTRYAPTLGGTIADQRARGWTLSAANQAIVGTPRTFDAAPAPVETISADLFPFVSGWSLYSGSCLDTDADKTNDPSSRVPTYFTSHPDSFEAFDPAETAAKRVLQPAVLLQVVNNNVPVPAGTTVRARSTVSGCTQVFALETTTSTLGQGFVTKAAGTSGIPFDPSLPFGEYEFCVPLNGNRRAVATIANTNPDGTTVQRLDVANVQSGMTCP
jgi:Tfp pilus assembly protein PilV